MKDRPLSRIVIDSDANAIYANGQRLALTCQQFEIFAYLWKKKTVSTYEQLYQNAYGLRPTCDQPARVSKCGNLPVLKVQISRMRPQLTPLGIAIVTIWGVGWRLEYQPSKAKPTHFAPRAIGARGDYLRPSTTADHEERVQ
jgi:DNA-binding response OmpR family regulator